MMHMLKQGALHTLLKATEEGGRLLRLLLKRRLQLLTGSC